MGKSKGDKESDGQGGVPEIGWATTGANPNVQPVAVAELDILRAGRNFTEAVSQGRALAAPGGREANQVAHLLQQTTARKHGLQFETAMKQAVTPSDVFKLVEGPHPTGKAAEMVVARVYKDLHTGKGVELVNPPTHVAANVVDVRLSPDTACRRDLLFQVQLPDGTLLTTPGGQVKTGSGQYLASTLVEMAQTRGYGRTAYVDARFVNTGSPRVAANAFTKAQAEKLREAGVRLRGIDDLDRQSQELVENLRNFQKDGLKPEARVQLQRLRDGIAAAYRPGGIATRVVGGAAIAAVSSALMSLLVQVLSDGKLDLVTVARTAGEASLIAGASTLSDAGLYHLSSWLGATPEVAQAVAAQGVATGFFLVAVATDAASEIRAAISGQTTRADAVMGTTMKVALDALPMLLVPFGLLGVPVALAGQVGGRWIIQRIRESDARLGQSHTENLEAAQRLTEEIDSMEPTIQRLSTMSDEVDAYHNRLMQRRRKPVLRVIQ